MTPRLNLSNATNESLPVTRGRLFDFPDDPIACMRQLKACHGNIAAVEEAGQRIYFAFGPEYNRQILTDVNTFHSRFYAIRGSRNSPQRRLTSGLLSMNGEQHKRQRRLVMDAFVKRAIYCYAPTIQTLTEELLSTWKPGAVRDVSRDLTDFMLRLTSTILFGIDDVEMAYRLGHMIDHWVHLNHEMGMGAYIANEGIADRYEDLLEFSGMLESQIKDMIAQRKKSPTGNDTLSLMINAHDSEGSISDEEMIGQAVLMFGAAHLTTAHSLTWTLFLLAQHPSVMSELHQELKTQLSGGFPGVDQIDRLSCTERVVKESMRILPASSYSQRVTVAPTQLGPFALAPSAGVVFSQFMTHHMPEIFPNPEEFRPERWLTINPSPYEYLPFGAGARMCIGAPLAMLIMKTVLPTILQRFKITVLPMSEVSGRVISTMLCPTAPLVMQLSEQDGRFESHPVRGNIHDMVDLREVQRSVRRAA